MLGSAFVDLDTRFEASIKDVHLEPLIATAMVAKIAIHTYAAIPTLGNGAPINVLAAKLLG
jgi:hypothetical protein